MSISIFCIEQRQKEQQALRKFLLFSFVGSAVFHVAMAFGIGWLWQRQPEIADDPIEVMVVENPDTEEKPLVDTPKPEPQPPAPAVPPKPVAQPPAPVVPPKPVAQLPAPVVPQRPVPQLPAPVVPQRPVPQLPAPVVPQRPVPQLPA